MKGNELLEMGIPRAVVPEAFRLIRQMAGRGAGVDEMRRVIAGVIESPRAIRSSARWRKGFSRVPRLSSRARRPRPSASGARGWSRGACGR